MSTQSRRMILMAGGMVMAHGALSVARAETGAGKVAMLAGGTAEESVEPGAAADTSSAYIAPAPAEAPASFPSTDPELVSAVVGASHAELDRVVELVTARPHLARSTLDWGFGDWESALGAASHMGRRDIAEFLIEHGARPDIFSAAMLGQLGAVRGMIEASPGVQRIPGPHGFTLLHHARMGGEPAAAVRDYLEGLGDADIGADSIELAEAQRQRLIGTYGFAAAFNDTLHIEDNRGVLALRREGAPFGRRIFPLSEHEFFPVGSPTVRIVFDLEGERVIGLRVIDSEVVVTAARSA